MLKIQIVFTDNGKLVIPPCLQKDIVAWYHHYLQHPEATRLEEMLRAAMTWDGLCKDVHRHTESCQSCQKNKRPKNKYGKLPTKIAWTVPWKVLCVDLISPYVLKGKDGSEVDFMCLTMMDPATNWFEIVELPVVDKPGSEISNLNVSTEYFDKTSQQIARLVNKLWFCRYPCCKHVVFDNGSEFKLYFRQLVESYRVEKKPTTIKNPQANSVLERVHQVFGNMLCTSELDMANSVNAESVSNFIDDAAWAVCSTYHTVLKSSPGVAIFGLGHVI